MVITLSGKSAIRDKSKKTRKQAVSVIAENGNTKQLKSKSVTIICAFGAGSTGDITHDNLKSTI